MLHPSSYINLRHNYKH